MNIAKNMEAVFFAALVLAGFTSFATANVVVSAPVAKAAATVAEAPMATVVVSTKRLTAAQKAKLGS